MGSAVSLRLKMWKGADGGADHDVGHWKAIIPLWATSQTFRKCRSFLSLGALRLRFFGDGYGSGDGTAGPHCCDTLNGIK